MRSAKGRSGVAAAACCAACAAFCLVAGPAAATQVYPAGGSTFTGGAQGWEVTEVSCNAPTICTASGGYDGTAGNPPGSIAANTNITVAPAGLVKSTITLQSPAFTVASAGDSTLHLDRQFVQGSLIDLAPQTTYAVNLIDRTAKTRSEVLTETVGASSAFTGKDHAATVKAGHIYALSITAETSSTVAGSGALGGTTSVRFDNVSLTVQPSSGGNGSGSGGSLTSQRLQSLIGNSLVGPAMLKGNRLSVKVRCPAKVGRTCKIAVQGLLKKRKPATSTGRVKVRKGKAKKVVLKVKPKALKKVAKSKKLLFKESVRAGKAHAAVYKRLKLIRR
jgi:hypothetical protein